MTIWEKLHIRILSRWSRGGDTEGAWKETAAVREEEDEMMARNNLKLKPCPFCGSVDVCFDVCFDVCGYKDFEGYGVTCNSCGAFFVNGKDEEFQRLAEVAKAWNERFVEEPLPRMKKEARVNLAKVNEMLGEEELLCQLAEECAELGKAALKLRRVLNGKNKTPVTLDEAEANITEEIADVIGVLTCLGCFDLADINNRYADIIDKKAQRWVERLTNLVEVGNGKK